MNRATLLIVLAAGAAYTLFNAAAGAMLPPAPDEERTRYGYWFRFIQTLAANGHRIAESKLLPEIAEKLAAESDGGYARHVALYPDPLRNFLVSQPAALQAAPSTAAPAAQESPAMSTTTPSTKSFFARAIADIGKFFAGFFSGILGSDEAKAVEAGIDAFIKTDVGALAVDAVQYASALGPGQTDDELRAAAVAKLKTDLQTAGKDLSALAESTLNLFIEMAYTYVQGTVAALPAAIGS